MSGTRKRVAVLVNLVPEKRGSMEDWLNQFVSRLSRDYTVAVATYGPCHPSVREGFDQCGASWHDLASIERSFSTARAWMMHHAEIAHMSLFAPRSLAVVAACTLGGTRVVFQDCYSSSLEPTRQSRVSRALDRVTFVRIPKVIAVSHFVAERIQARFGVDAPRLEVVYNGVDIGRFRVEAPASECSNVLCVAALIPDKGVDVLIRAFTEPSLSARQLLICGDGPQRGELEALAVQLGVSERIRFLGLRNDVHALVGDAAVAVHPAVWGEAFGLTIAEAMAAGRPVVGTRVGAVPELVEHGVTGLVVPPSDPAALATAISTLLADPPLRDAMGRSARRRVEERFSMDTWVDRHVRIIDQLAVAR